MWLGVKLAHGVLWVVGSCLFCWVSLVRGGWRLVAVGWCLVLMAEHVVSLRSNPWVFGCLRVLVKGETRNSML